MSLDTFDPAAPTPVALEHAFFVVVGTSILGAFMEVSGLGMSYATHDYEEGGNNDFVHRLPGRASHPNLTLRTGLMRQPVLFRWAQRKGEFAAPQIVTIVFTDPAGLPFTWFQLQHATPVRWTGPTGNIGANAAATESLEIAHQGMV